MNLTPDIQNKSVTIVFDDSEWIVIRYVIRIYGLGFFIEYIQKFITQRRSQQESRRQEILNTWFAGLNDNEKVAFLAEKNIQFGDE